MKNREYVNYDVTYDIGTNSVGYAVMDEFGNLLKKGRSHLWGSVLFDSAETAQTRRLSRSSRRRYKKRKVRVRLLRQLMNDMVLSADPLFFYRLEKTTFLDEEDKKDKLKNDYKMNYNLFCDVDYNDKDYYRDYATIYHLRKKLCETDEKMDPRLIYLALHHIIKYRGNFLYEGQKLQLDGSNKIDDLKELLNELYLVDDIVYDINEDQIRKIIDILKQPVSKKGKVEQCKKILISSKMDKNQISSIEHFLTGLVGNQFKVNKLFYLEDYDEMKLKFSQVDYDEKMEEYSSSIGEKTEFISMMQNFNSWIELNKIIGDYTTISEAMVNIYETHKKDLKKLKTLLKNAGKKEYDEMFKKTNKKIVNYHNYVNNINKTQKDLVDAFYDYCKKTLENINNPVAVELIKKIDNGTFMLKQTSKDNSAIPYQMQKAELIKILDHQEKYYPELKENRDKIISILEFRIPYFYGPLDGNDKFGWLVKKEGKEDERILPWNYREIVDEETTAQNFITKLTNHCTYLPDELVMPKKSLTCSMYEVLSEINKIRVDDRLLSVDIKNRIIKELFLKKKTIKERDLKKWFKLNNVFLNNEDLKITGYQKDKEFSTSLTPWIDFSKIFGEIDDGNYDMIERIISDITIFNEGSILKRRLKKNYHLDDDKIKKILKLNYTGWSRLSRKLLDGIRTDNKYGTSVSILDVMKQSNLVLMEIINDKKLGYDKIIEKENTLEVEQKLTYDVINELQGSPALKRGIWTTMQVLEEIKHYMKHDPKNVYIEFARNEGKKERTISRVKKYKDIYNEISHQLDQYEQEAYSQLKQTKDGTSIEKRLNLYFMQLGKCMYTGEKLEIDQLFNYQIDHIYPQSLIDDDSIDNIVLVKTKENQRKLDSLVVPLEIRKKMIPFWKKLADSGLISPKKYNRLIRTEFTQDQIDGFINRQLVETRQIVKHTTNIIKNYYPNTKVYSIRASFTDQFRKNYKLYKNRDVNDLHHAHDAYIIGIVGQYIQRRFPNLESKFVYNQYIKEVKKNKKKTDKEKFGFIINSMKYTYYDQETGEVIWNAQRIEDYLKCFNYKDVFVTKKLDTYNGKLFDIQPIKNDKNSEKGKTDARIPVNKERGDIHKYGGYTGLQNDIVAVERVKGKKIERKLVKLPIIYRNRTFDEKINFLKEDNKYSEVKIIRYIKKNQLVEIDGIPYYIKGATELDTAYQIVLNKKENELVYHILEAIKHDKYEYFKDKQENLDSLYNKSMNKLKDCYPKYNKKIYDVIKKHEDAYDTLDLSQKCQLIYGVIKVMKRGEQYINIPFAPYNLKNERIGRLSSQSILLDNTYFYDISVTGIYRKKYKL